MLGVFAGWRGRRGAAPRWGSEPFPIQPTTYEMKFPCNRNINCRGHQQYHRDVYENSQHFKSSFGYVVVLVRLLCHFLVLQCGCRTTRAAGKCPSHVHTD